eukprot:c20896_g1_i1 orf=37-1431(+)
MTQKPHVVVLPLGSKGHINPMMLFSKLLAAQGIVITFVNTEFNSKHMEKSENPSELRKAGLDIRFEQLPDGLPASLDRTAHVLDLCESQATTMAQPFHALLERLFLHDPPPSCILADTLLTFTLDSAFKFGLPHASFWTQAAASFASSLMVARGYRPPQELEVPGASFLKAADVNTFLQSYDSTKFIFRFLTGCFDRLRESRWIFINTFENLEQKTLSALIAEEHVQTVLAIGPLMPPSFLTQNECDENPQEETLLVKEEDCLRWLDKFEPNSVLYISFGSLALLSSQQVEEIALGLEASGYPFLWATRPDLIYGESPNFTKDFLERVKDRTLFVSWVSQQLKVLNHRAIGGFFTHGGWNSTLEGIIAGVPMLGWPYFSDQPMDCKCIEQGWKIGLRLREDDDVKEERLVLRGVIEAKVKALMSCSEFRSRSHEWSTLAKEAISQGGSSFNNIQSFVDALKSTL